MSEHVAQSDIALAYVMSLLPQLITLVAAIAAGFKFLQKHNERRVEEMKNSILAKFDVERQFVERDMKAINAGINSLDSQYRIITSYIRENIERHERMLDKLEDNR